MTKIKKIELTCQQLWDAGIEVVEPDNTRLEYVLKCSNGCTFAIRQMLFTITDLPESGVATKPADESEWIGKPCLFWNDGCGKNLGILYNINTDFINEYYDGSNSYKNCKLATKEEVLDWFEKNGGKEC